MRARAHAYASCRRYCAQGLSPRARPAPLRSRANAPCPAAPPRRYLRDAANSTGLALIDNSYDALRCARPVLHPAWAPRTALNDIAVCVLSGAARFEPVALAGLLGARARVWWGARAGVQPRLLAAYDGQQQLARLCLLRTM